MLEITREIQTSDGVVTKDEFCLVQRFGSSSSYKGSFHLSIDEAANLKALLNARTDL